MKVGKGNVVVVSPPGSYDNMVHPEGHPSAPGGGGVQDFRAPPDYTLGLEDSGFSDGAIRRGFIRKVYLTLMIQLLVTVGIICAFLYWRTLRIWSWHHPWFTYSMMVSTLVLIMVLACCDNVRRKVPLNFIALGLLIFFFRLFEAEAVLWAIGATALVAFSLTLFAMQSKWDFTMASGALWVFAWTLFSFALLCAILRTEFVYITYACLGTLLFSLYLVFDTQLILGGKHRKYEISPEEYVFAALSLYLDIVSLFLLLLQLIGLCR
uniref:Zgc:110410 n=1 Tax=Sphaeramia orbicularis TaxID=375764 RepID=A0A672YZH5_9TELE